MQNITNKITSNKMSDLIFVKNDKLTKFYQTYFREPGIIGYERYLSEERKEYKLYYLVLTNTGKKILFGGSEASVSMHIEDIYLRSPRDILKPYPTVAELKREVNKMERKQKRLDLIKQVSMIKTWGRGVVAKIASDLGRTVGAVRQMLSVLTKQGLLVRIQRGQYAVA